MRTEEQPDLDAAIRDVDVNLSRSSAALLLECALREIQRIRQG